MESYGYLFLSGLISNMETAVITLYGPLIGSFRGLALTFLTIWIVLVGYAFIQGMLKEHGRSILTSTAILAIVSGIVFSARVYADWVYYPVINLMQDLAAFIVAPNAPGGLPGLFTGLDYRFTQVFAFIEAIGDEGSITNLTPYLFSMLMGAVFAILYSVFIVYMAIGFFGVNVLMVFGGIFLFFAAFKGTRFLFASWLRAMCNYALVPIFTSLVMSITLGFIESAFADLVVSKTESLWNIEIGNALLVGVLGIFFHLKASDFAAAITGGQPAGLMGMAALAPGVASTLKGGMAAPGAKVGEIGLKAAWRAYSSRRGIK